MKRIFILSCLALGAPLALSATTTPAPVPAPAPAAAPAAVVPAVSLAVTGNKNKKIGDEMECLLEPHMVSNVGSPVEGILNQVMVDRGDVVRRGQVVARLNSAVESATVDLKRAQEAFGQRKMQRNEDLYNKELISSSEKDELETQIRIAALERRQQQEILALRTIVSPLNGIVVARYLSPGDRVSQDKILRIAQIDPLNVEVVMPAELYGSIKIGMAGEVRLPGGGTSAKAKVVLVDRLVDAASGTFGVRLALPNPGNQIPAGVKCSVRF